MIEFLKRLQLYFKQKCEKQWHNRLNPLLKQAASQKNLPADDTDESIDVELPLESVADSRDYQPTQGELDYLLREWNQFLNRLGRATITPLSIN